MYRHTLSHLNIEKRKEEKDIGICKSNYLNSWNDMNPLPEEL